MRVLVSLVGKGVSRLKRARAAVTVVNSSGGVVVLARQVHSRSVALKLSPGAYVVEVAMLGQSSATRALVGTANLLPPRHASRKALRLRVVLKSLPARSAAHFQSASARLAAASNPIVTVGKITRDDLTDSGLEGFVTNDLFQNWHDQGVTFIDTSKTFLDARATEQWLMDNGRTEFQGQLGPLQNPDYVVSGHFSDNLDGTFTLEILVTDTHTGQVVDKDRTIGTEDSALDMIKEIADSINAPTRPC